ncbi:hypothetical protein LSH36_157g00022, partial [Paralvinella palmiformis]
KSLCSAIYYTRSIREVGVLNLMPTYTEALNGMLYNRSQQRNQAHPSIHIYLPNAVVFTRVPVSLTLPCPPPALRAPSEVYASDVTQCKNAEAVGDSCVCHGLLQFVPVVDCISVSMIRKKVREARGIPGGLCGDMINSWFCYFCVLVQTAQEVEHIEPREQNISRT